MTNIDSVNPPPVPDQVPPCTNPQVELEVEKPLLVLIHNRSNRLKIIITPSTCRGDKFRIEIKRASGGGWLPLGGCRSMLWMGVVAGKFKLRGIATIEGSEVISPEKDVEVRFPNYAEIISDARVASLVSREWGLTLRDCRQLRKRDASGLNLSVRRERGFFIRVDSEANRYIGTNPARGPLVGNYDRAGIYMGGRSKPADEPADPPANGPGSRYVVASFHTHTSTAFLPFSRPPREVGPSDEDNAINSARQIPGVVYDYVAVTSNGRDIPIGHPKESAAQLYRSLGVDPRPTP